MHATCEKCGTEYNIDDAKLGARGKTVRCTKCYHMWFVEGPMPPPPQEGPLVIRTESSPATPEDMAAFREMVQNLGQGAGYGAGQNVASSARDTAPPVLEAIPAGMNANQFGLFTFLFLLFASLTVLFAARGAVTAHFPSMITFYEGLGFHIHAPGEGLKFADLTTRTRVKDGVKILDINANVSNIGEETKLYPPVRIEVQSTYGAMLKSWDIKADRKEIKPGETLPFGISLSGVPEDGKAVQIKVTGG